MDGGAIPDRSPESLDPPDLVPGRVLHIDADFLAYQCGYRYDEEPVSTSIENLKVRIETLRIMAGAETVSLHLTRGNKGGREQIARLQQYQEQRQDRDPGLAERVRELREYMSSRDDGQPWFDQEADDGLAQAMWQAHITDTPHLHVLWSLDKDLWMVGGLHMDGDNYEISAYPWGYGRSEYDPEKKKVVGCGTSFFWHQLLMGDSADTIPGLPTVTRDMVLKYLPHPKYLSDAYQRSAKTKAQRIAKRKAIEAAEAKIKSKPCGAATAAKLLADCADDTQAARRCYELYADLYGGSHRLVTWDQKDEVYTAGEMLLEQARLLWMRRVEDEDVLTWIGTLMQEAP